MSKTDWKKIYQDHSPKLLGICRRYIQDIYTAEDIVQDSFIAAIQNKHQLRDENLLFAWLKKIVVNNALQYLRKNSKETFLNTEISEIPDILLEMSDPVSEDKKNIFIYNFTREELLSSIDSLPSHHKSVFNLYCIEHYSHADISGLLGISVNTSKSHLLRAKKSIQKHLLNHVNHNTAKNKNKIVQLLVLLGFGNFLWAQTFKQIFLDFSITSSKVFEIPETLNFNTLSSPSISHQVVKKKIIICGTLLIIIASFFIFKTKNNYFVKERPIPVSRLDTETKNKALENVSTKPAPIKANLNPNNSPTSISEIQYISDNRNTKKKVKTISKDSIENSHKKVIIVRKIIQRDTIFVEQ